MQRGQILTARKDNKDPSEPTSDILLNLLRDSDASLINYLAETYGIMRVPGLSHDKLIQRLLRHLTADEADSLRGDLIAARFGNAPVAALLEMILENAGGAEGLKRRPRVDQISPHEATLLQGGPQVWTYTMRGYDVMINAMSHTLMCSCPFFGFAARRRGLCKHLVLAFKLIPDAYARTILIDLVVAQLYGNKDTDPWHFKGETAA